MNIPSLKVSENGRYLLQPGGSLFLYLADTAWALFHKLNREDALLYLDDRAEKGFTVIQAVALDEADGIRTPNAYGRLPLRTNARGEWDPTLPDTEPGYSYWDHVRFIVDAAEQRGLFVALLPTWGDKFNKGNGAQGLKSLKQRMPMPMADGWANSIGIRLISYGFWRGQAA
jgi:hypothetical protein